MTPIPYQADLAAEDAPSFVVAHLTLHDKRFRGDSKRAKRNRERAEQHAKKLLKSYESGGYEAVEGVIAGWLVSILIGVLISFSTTWIERMLNNLISEWLKSENSDGYRRAVSAAHYAKSINGPR